MTKKKGEKSVTKEILNKMSKLEGVKEIAEAKPEDFQSMVAKELGMVRELLMHIVEWTAGQQDNLIDVLKDKFNTIQKDLDMTEENFQDIGDHMDSVKLMAFFLWAEITQHTEKAVVPYEKRKGVAQLLHLDLDGMGKQLKEISAQKGAE